ncbi:MAG TPA: transketolase family protein [Clostridiales bacterium]|nr:transketolase family protein [Clostridiales bacterium]
MVNTKSQRVAYGETLVRLAAENPKIVDLEADLCKSTMGILFEKAYPERFFEMGIAEANMVSVAAGLSLTGKIPFAASFAVFVSGRAYDQIRTSVCIPALNVKLCGSSAGLSDFGDGSTHQCLEDIALMRVLPNMHVFVPADAVQTAQIVEYMADNHGPMYIRLDRNELPIVTTEPFIPGKIYELHEGSDIAVFACGVMVSKALEAASILKEKGISMAVYNTPSIKPINEDAVAEAGKKVKAVITAEDHSMYGGLGSLICEIFCRHGVGKKVKMIAVPDKFGTSAEDYETLLTYYGLTADAIVNSALELLR